MNRVTHDHIDVHFVTTRRNRDRRLSRVEPVGAAFVHHLRLRTLADCDSQLEARLREAYRWGEADGGGKGR